VRKLVVAGMLAAFAAAIALPTVALESAQAATKKKTEKPAKKKPGNKM
jgi:hypothetical protein